MDYYLKGTLIEEMYSMRSSFLRKDSATVEINQVVLVAEQIEGEMNLNQLPVVVVVDHFGRVLKILAEQVDFVRESDISPLRPVD